MPVPEAKPACVGLVAVNESKPRWQTQTILLATLLFVVLPAIWFAAIGYRWFIEHGMGLDTHARPETVVDRLVILVTVLPMIPVMLVAILAAGIPWMFVVSRLLRWADLEYYTKQKGPRVPVLSDWLDRLWRRMIESRRPESSNPVAKYLQRYRDGHRDEAFFGLLETGHEVLPDLMAAFRRESDARVRAFLVEVIWQYRQPLVIPFLGEALQDLEAGVWREALNGLVALASPAALEVLRSAHDSAGGERRRWILEAMEQVQEQTLGGTPSVGGRRQPTG